MNRSISMIPTTSSAHVSIARGAIPYCNMRTRTVGLDAPKNWFAGIHEFMRKILITSGAKEYMYTAHQRLVLKTIYLDVEFVVTDGARGVHDDMLFDFVIPGEKTENLSPTTAVIVD